MICPSCIGTNLGPGWIVAFAICILFFVVALGVMLWASGNGRLENLEDTKYKMLHDD